jgi:hypothetical protein
VGKTYRLTIPRPRADKLPFVCSLNFVANQYEMGDLIQVRLNKSSLIVPMHESIAADVNIKHLHAVHFDANKILMCKA